MFLFFIIFICFSNYVFGMENDNNLVEQYQTQLKQIFNCQQETQDQFENECKNFMNDFSEACKKGRLTNKDTQNISQEYHGFLGLFAI
ncbi:hypothetical protein EKK58_07215 [Candidatus Dependentiae bacterium]|nr:MAG: hypothetical protein EKK58_07215 [Candidatus Dependentiae bacterium]